MRLDFWNNPLVVSAFRVKYRRGGIFHFTALYMLLLVAGGALLYYQAQSLSIRLWQQVYLLLLLGIQCVISPLLAAVATSAAMKSEVVNRTLDFQRIAALSPRQILVGKLLGEPALAYLLALCTVPLAVWCLALGVPGLGPLELLLLYVNLVTTTVLFGSVGLLNRLEIGEGKLSGGGAAGGFAWGWIITSVWIALGTGLRNPNTPWYAVPGGLLSPVLALSGLADENPWESAALLYSVRVPFLPLTPVVQLLAAGLCFHSMVRRLVNPLDTPLGKSTAYFLLILIDVFAAGLLYQYLVPVTDVAHSIAVFCVIHLLASLGLILTVTPGRESLQSWVWRLRGRSSRLWALWVGERSENVLVLATFCAIGAVCLFVCLLLPAALRHGWPEMGRAAADSIAPAGLALLLTLSLGTAYQWFETFPLGRSSSGAFGTLVALAVAVPHLFGRYYQIREILALSPLAQFFQWTIDGSINLKGTLPLWPVVALYGAVLVLTRLSLRSRLSRYEKAVDQKLQQMGVPGYGSR